MIESHFETLRFGTLATVMPALTNALSTGAITARLLLTKLSSPERFSIKEKIAREVSLLITAKTEGAGTVSVFVQLTSIKITEDKRIITWILCRIY